MTMKPATVYILEMIFCSAVLHLFYRLLVEGRVRYSGCRLYLLAATLLPALIPALDIRLWQDRIIYYEVPAEQVSEPAAHVTVGQQLATEMPSDIWATVLVALYAAGAAAIAAMLAIQLVKLRRTARRNASVHDSDGCRIVVSERIREPFSFLRTIYMPSSLDENDRESIIRHETAHIRHRHSIERLAMEAMKAAMWFNPFVWSFVRMLVEVQEYEADRDVIDSGFDKAKYANTIFKRTFGYSPDITNGLRSSLTKKRFKMMTTRKPSRTSLLRLAGSLPVIATLTMLFSVRAQATRYIAVEQPALPEVQQPEQIDQTQAKGDGKLERDGKQVATVHLSQQSDGKQVATAHISPKSWEVPAVDSPVAVVCFEENGYEPSPEHAPILLYAGEEVPIDYMLKNKFPRSQVQMSLSVMNYDKAVERFGERAKWGVLTASPIYTLAQILADPKFDGYRFVIDGRIVGRDGIGITDADVVSITVSAAGSKLANYGTWGEKNDVVQITTGKGVVSTIGGEEPYLMAKNMPVFGDGGNLVDFRHYIESKIQLPAEAAEIGLTDGRVIVRFVVEKDGSIKVVDHVAGPAIYAETIIDAIKSTSGQWTGGSQDGEAVRIIYTLPVDFTTL